MRTIKSYRYDDNPNGRCPLVEFVVRVETDPYGDVDVAFEILDIHTGKALRTVIKLPRIEMATGGLVDVVCEQLRRQLRSGNHAARRSSFPGHRYDLSAEVARSIRAGSLTDFLIPRLLHDVHQPGD